VLVLFKDIAWLLDSVFETYILMGVMGVNKFFVLKPNILFCSCRFFIYLVCVCVCVRERERERGREVNTIGPLPWQLFWGLYAMWSLHPPGISSYSLAVYLTLCHSIVVEYQPSPPKQALHILKIFFHMEQRSFLEILTVSLQKLTILPIKVDCCTVSSLLKSWEWLWG